jgi:transposase-like protein
MHRSKRLRVIGSRRGGTYAKAVVMGMLERESGTVRARVIDSVEGTNLKRVLRQNIEPGTELITDSASGYRGLGGEFFHQWINHMKEYVRGHVHTNGLENFWSLLKRAIKGTYVNVEPYHLHRYVEEQAFRYNERFGKDGDRFLMVLRGIVGRRITYKQLTSAPATT